MLFVFFCKQKTAYEMRISDWSSDVCSSDLIRERRDAQEQRLDRQQHLRAVRQRQQKLAGFDAPRLARETVDLYRALVDTDQRGAGNAGRQFAVADQFRDDRIVIASGVTLVDVVVRAANADRRDRCSSAILHVLDSAAQPTTRATATTHQPEKAPSRRS